MLYLDLNLCLKKTCFLFSTLAADATKTEQRESLPNPSTVLTAKPKEDNPTRRSVPASL